MPRRNFALSHLTETDLNIVLGLIDDLTQNLDTKGRLAVTAILSGALSLKDADLTIVDDVDGSKRFQFQASGITAGTKRTYTVPDADTTLVGTATTQTLSNKTLDNTNTLTVKDANFTIQDDGNTARQVKFQLAGLSAATRTVTPPDADTTLPVATQVLTYTGPTAPRTITLPDSNTSVPAATQTLTLTGPTAPRTITLPDANFSAARIDAGQTFQGNQLVALAATIAGATAPQSTSALDVRGAIYMPGAAAPTFVNGAWVWSETGVGLGIQGGGSLRFRTNSTTTDQLTIAASGDATFASKINCLYETYTNQTAPATPAAGKLNLWADSTAKILVYTDDAGVHHAQSINSAVTNQTPAAATDVYITNSDLLIPSFSVQAKTQILWKFSVSKTAAGVATPIYNIRIGTNKSTADTARLTLTGPAQTAIADIGTLNILLTVRNISASVGVIQATAWWDHRGTAASSTIGVGFSNDGTGHVEGTSAGFANSALGGSSIGLSINTGTSAAWTITQVQGEAIWG